MKRVAIALAVIAAPISPLSASKFAMIVSPGEHQNARMQDGVAAIDSYGETSTARLVRPDEPIKKRSTIQLLVMNQGQQSFNLGPENVRAELEDGTPVAIIHYEQLVREEKRRRTWAAIAAGLAAGANSYSASQAGYGSGTATYQSNSYGTFGRTPYTATTYGTATYSTYDPAAAQIAQSNARMENQAMFDRMAANNAGRMSALKEIMRTTTIDPGQVFGGSVMFELPPKVRSSRVDVPVVFVVTTGGEEHRFKTVLQRQ